MTYTINFTINLGVMFYLILAIMWIAFPIVVEWGKIYAKDKRNEKPVWQILSLVVVLPSLAFFSLISMILIFINNIIEVLDKAIIKALGRMMLPKDK